MASSENQSPSIEELGVGVVAQVECHGIEAALVVDMLQPIVADGYEFRLVVGGSARLGKPFHASRPEDVSLSVAHPVYLFLQLLVGMYRTVLGKGIVVLYCGEGIFPSYLGVGSLFEQSCQHFALEYFTFGLVAFQLMHPVYEDMAYNIR